MRRQSLIIPLLSAVTLAVMGVGSFLLPAGLWGVNHFHFLPDSYAYLFWLVAVLVLIAATAPVPERLIGRGIDALDKYLWGSDRLGRCSVAVASAIVFYFFRVEVHLLGDGYTWLATFGQGESFIHKWAEPGSILLVRQIQWLLGGYTQETALAAFRFLSIASGVVFVYTLISVLGYLCRDTRVRIIALATSLLSGATLLYFGYVEFYPLSWAMSMVFINAAIRAIHDRRFLWLAGLAYLAAMLVHVQVLYFLPALVFLLISRVKRRRWQRVAYGLGAAAAIVAAMFAVWLYHSRPELRHLILPLFQARPVAPDYTVFSLPHLSDLSNQLLLVFPGALILLGLWLSLRPRVRRDAATWFLGLMSAGSLLFLLLYGAAITMARDWDVMSLALLAPFLFLLYQLDVSRSSISVRTVVLYVLVTATASLSFLGVSTQAATSEGRFASLLNSYNRSGWAIYAGYLRRKGNEERYREIIEQMNTRFPEYASLRAAYAHLRRGNLAAARSLAERAIARNPFDANFLQLLGNVHWYAGRFLDAEQALLQAYRLSPYQPDLLNDLGQFYMARQQYEEASQYLQSARALALDVTEIAEALGWTCIYRSDYRAAIALADTLFMAEATSPGGHLLKMGVALARKNKSMAQHHLREYLAHGAGRPDYESVKAQYGKLLD